MRTYIKIIFRIQLFKIHRQTHDAFLTTIVSLLSWAYRGESLISLVRAARTWYTPLPIARLFYMYSIWLFIKCYRYNDIYTFVCTREWLVFGSFILPLGYWTFEMLEYEEIGGELIIWYLFWERYDNIIQHPYRVYGIHNIQYIFIRNIV